jgi:hypothetical protein
MGSAKYVGLDVHKDTISIAVMNSAGKLIMESIIETKGFTILQFFQGLHGDVYGLRTAKHYGWHRRYPFRFSGPFDFRTGSMLED